MEGIYDWIRNLISFLLLMTLITNLLPDKKYEKYLRLFTGAVFLLLFFSPLTDLYGLERKMAGAFERITFQTDVQLLKKEIENVDGVRMQQVISQYENILKQELKSMAENIEADCEAVELVMETDRERETFGKVKQVKLVFSQDKSVGPERAMENNRRISELRTQIGDYYGVEEGNIAILVETK